VQFLRGESLAKALQSYVDKDEKVREASAEYPEQG
jgi:hypothetical protein